MRTIDRYLGGQFARGVLVVTLVLTALFGVLELVGELDNVGKGRYGLAQALGYVLLTLPGHVVTLVPISALLGSVIAVGLLADRHELMAMRALGLSPQRVCWSVIGSGALLMFGVALVAEFAVPPLERQARMVRSSALSGPDVLLTEQGFWTRNGRSLIHVRGTRDGSVPLDLDIFTRDEAGRLRTFTHAREAEVQADGHWLLQGVNQQFVDERGALRSRAVATLRWADPVLETTQVALLGLPPGTLAPSQLLRYVRTLEAKGENAERYALAFWQSVASPLTTGAMVLLSLPFVFSHPRQTSAGRRIVLGASAGVGVYFAAQILGRVGLLLGLPPAATTLTPVVAVLIAALALMKRIP